MGQEATESDWLTKIPSHSVDEGWYQVVGPHECPEFPQFSKALPQVWVCRAMVSPILLLFVGKCPPFLAKVSIH